MTAPNVMFTTNRDKYRLPASAIDIVGKEARYWPVAVAALSGGRSLEAQRELVELLVRAGFCPRLRRLVKATGGHNGYFGSVSHGSTLPDGAVTYSKDEIETVRSLLIDPASAIPDDIRESIEEWFERQCHGDDGQPDKRSSLVCAVRTLDGGDAGTIMLQGAIFGLEPRADIIHRVVRYQLAKRQAGTHRTLPRGEINRTKKKLYKQKGTGGARHGAASAPQFRGGGRAFGPVVRSHAHDLQKKVRALGLKHALSAKAKDAAIIVVDDVVVPEPKTKALKGHFEKLGVANALVVGGTEIDRNFGLAARAIPNVDVLPVQGINVYDIMRREKLVLTKAAVDALEARFK